MGRTAKSGVSSAALWISWIAVILWMAVIFFFSSENSEMSGRRSGAVYELIADLFFGGDTGADGVDGGAWLLRKTAHMGEYGILGAFAANAMSRLLARLGAGFGVRRRTHTTAGGALISGIVRVFSGRAGAAGRRTRAFLRVFLFAVALCVLYAASDELHQYFVPGRVASGGDVLIDGVGASAGAAIVLALGRLRRRR